MRRAPPAVLCLAASLAALPALAQPRVAEEVVARVGGRVITRGEVDSYLLQSGIESSLTEGPSEVARRKEDVWRAALRELVVRKLIVHAVERAAREGEAMGYILQVSRAELDSDLRDLSRRLGFPSTEAYRAALESRGVGYSLARERRREWLLERRFRFWKGRERAPVSPEAMRRRYEENPGRYRAQGLRLRVLMLRVRDAADAAEREGRRGEIESLRARVASGQATLEELARLHSNGAYAQEGGLWPPARDDRGEPLPLLSPADLPEEVREHAMSLPIGELSPVVFTLGRPVPGGGLQPSFYWLFAVEEREEGPPLPFDDVQGILHREMEREARDLYLEYEYGKLWAGASVWIAPGVGEVEPPPLPPRVVPPIETPGR